jgi:polyphosphate kinase
MPAEDTNTLTIEESVATDRLTRKDYERELARLHVELVKLQQWVQH